MIKYDYCGMILTSANLQRRSMRGRLPGNCTLQII